MTRCSWCGRDQRQMSDWEQEHHHNGWQRLCRPCARDRLRNPWNALMRLRTIPQPATSAEEPDHG
jgi:hypothetical protein